MILNRQRKVRVARGPLDAFLRRVRKELELAGNDVTICLVSDAEMARMNEAFRKKKGPTDVLSFPAGKLWRAASDPSTSLRASEWREKRKNKHAGAVGAKAAGKRTRSHTEIAEGTQDTEKQRRARSSPARYLGDIAIAPETARRYAKKNGRSLGGELRVLILHGVLHLLGYDHETDHGQMSRIEKRLRRRLGLA